MRRFAVSHPRTLGWALALASAFATAPAAAGLPSGEKAPGFSLKTVDKGEVKALAELGKGKSATVVMFLSCKCPYVKEAREPIGALVKQFGSKVQFVGINANQTESGDDIKADAASSFPFPMLLDEGSKVADLYKAERTPEVFVVDPKGVIRYHGGVADLGAALTDLLAGKPVAKPDAKSFGCTIKRKS